MSIDKTERTYIIKLYIAENCCSFFSLLREKNCLISCYCYGYFNRFFVFLLFVTWLIFNGIKWSVVSFLLFLKLASIKWRIFFRYLIVSEEIRYFLYNFSSFFFFFWYQQKTWVDTFSTRLILKKISFTCIFSLLFIINKTNTFFIYKVYLHKKSDCVLFAKKKNLLYKDNFFYVFFIVLGCYDQQIETCP